MRLGAQPVHPQELTKVSDWGEHVQATTLRLERRRVSVILAQVVPLKGRAVIESFSGCLATHPMS
ncbi:hypothetical protein BSQ98_24595 [Serratia liquefaciens]|nr:hypothetical protein BSQ35_07045 [Serratia liquefaciens]PVD45709.1 hypothetical protein C5188_15335 [Serratia liquefaciens]RYM58870.1 hypothetical protein BSQ98_24595 [Serratia liquefaciens]